MAFGIGAPVVSFWVAAIFYSRLAQAFSAYITSPAVCIIVSYLLIFIAAFLFMKILQHITGSIFDNDIFNSLNKMLGFIFGIFAALAVIIFLIVILLMIPDEGLNQSVKESLSYTYINKFISFPDVNLFGK